MKENGIPPIAKTQKCILKLTAKSSHYKIYFLAFFLTFLNSILQGLKDENHHVLIQSLTAFNMIFPIILSKYLASSDESYSLCQPAFVADSPQHHRTDSNQIDDVDGYDEKEDEFDDSLLNTTMDNNLSNTLNRNRQASSEEGENVESEGFKPTRCRVSPKYLLNKAFRCRNNKYWLVQNKYAETISNLDYFLLSSAFGEEFQHWLMVSFSDYLYFYG